MKKAGQAKVQAFLTEAIRRCKPEVIVTLDEHGEGKNGQRMMLADACRQCGIASTRRPETLAPQDFRQLVAYFADITLDFPWQT